MAHAADGGGGVGTLPRSSLSQTPSPTTAVIPREGGESSTPRCHDSLTGVSGILDRPPARTMTPGTTDMRSPSRGAIRPSFSFRVTPPSKEGCREGRVPDGTRGPLREMHTQEEPHSSIQVKPNTRPSLRDGRTAYAVLSREPNSFWPPSPRRKSPAPRRLTRLPHSQGLDRSNDGQDHTVLPYARPAISPQFSRPCRRSRKLAGETKPGSAVRPRDAKDSRRAIRPAPGLSRPTLPRPPQTRLANMTTTRSPLENEPGWATHTANQNFGKAEYLYTMGLTRERNTELPGVIPGRRTAASPESI